MCVCCLNKLNYFSEAPNNYIMDWFITALQCFSSIVNVMALLLIDAVSLKGDEFSLSWKLVLHSRCCYWIFFHVMLCVVQTVQVRKENFQKVINGLVITVGTVISLLTIWLHCQHSWKLCQHKIIGIRYTYLLIKCPKLCHRFLEVPCFNTTPS